jgi:beta-lactamase regulating signal transducer with metallopeptidase domain
MSGWPAEIADRVDAVAIASAVNAWLTHSVLEGTALALLTAVLVRTMLRRANPAIHGALWTIVLLKFIMPFGPPSRYSLATLVSAVAGLNPSPPAAVPAADVASGYEQTVTVSLTSSGGTVSTSSGNADAPGSSWMTGLAVSYLVLLAAVGAVRVAAYVRYLRRCRRLPPVDGSVQRLVAQVASRLGLRRIPLVRRSDSAPAPFVLGFWKPTLVLSRRQLDHPAELEAVILHEVAHLRRGDLLVRHLQWLAGTGLFFWPVVAWVNRRLDLASEYVCDQWALRHSQLTPGQYARCLLRATQPVRPVLAAYAPAAMAASSSHVERRIEMILKSTPMRTRGTWAAAAAMLLLGWSSLVLTGAAVLPPQESSQAVSSWGSAGPGVEDTIIFVAAGDGSDASCVMVPCIPPLCPPGCLPFCPPDCPPPDCLFGPPAPIGPGPGVVMGDNVMFFMVDDAAGPGAAGETFEIALTCGPNETMLAKFAETHPAADADGDGAVTRAEHDAYLVALALGEPSAVLTKFPAADRDADRKLSAAEAARLVAVGLPDIRPLPGPGRFITHGPVQGAADEPVRIMRQALDGAASGDDAKPVVHHIIRQIHSGDGAPAEAPTEGVIVLRGPDGANRPADSARSPMVCMPAPALPAPWILGNVEGSPTRIEVQRYLPLVAAAPLAAFLEANPKADANHDGTLTAAERDAYIERMMSEGRSRLLRRFPQADANGDGVLSDLELREFHRQRMGAAGGMMKVECIDDPDQPGHKRVTIISGGPDEANVECIVAPAPDPGPVGDE